MATPHPLLLASDTRPPVVEVDAPRIDFLELAARLGGEMTYAAADSGAVKRIERTLALDLRQAWQASRRRDVSVYVSLSEKAGLPLALLPKRAPHLLVAHYLTSGKKRALHKRTGCLHRFDEIIVLCRFQERYLLDEVGLAPEKVRFVYDKVDHYFWIPGTPAEVQPNLVLSVGRERRDYETLMASAQQLPHLRFVIVASSPWSKGTEAAGREVPANVTVKRGLSWVELRELYRQAALVVVPLQAGCEYAAGVNAVLEAMAMQKPLIVSKTPGIADYVDNGYNAWSAPAANVTGLAEKIADLSADTVTAERLARSARATVDGGRNLDRYLDALTQAVQSVAIGANRRAATESRPA